ncbi:MAG: DNA (cytosine-5-)-methyltransferase [Candidatus Saccharibacteria bacterium]|nr:DNA (cytosine-5-)-methyltransferase [Candidatus Saccharibacteria bacterium]
MDLKSIDLYAGMGGIRLGFSQRGFKTVFANDCDVRCKLIYDANFSEAQLDTRDIGAIKTHSLPDFDFLLAGFPCQAFSIAGYQKGLEDERGNQFFNIIKILKVKKPLGFLLENVKNMRSHDGGRTFRIMSQALRDVGYHFQAQVMNTMEYGNLPQNRERIYIVGFKDPKLCDNFIFPNPIALIQTIQDMLDDPQDIDDKYYYNDKPLFESLKDYPFKQGQVYQWRRKYIRKNQKGVCPTLTANMGTGGHNVPLIQDGRGLRKLTPRECARLQGFDDSYLLPEELSDTVLYHKIGNSVSVPVIQAVARQITQAFDYQNAKPVRQLQLVASHTS